MNTKIPAKHAAWLSAWTNAHREELAKTQTEQGDKPVAVLFDGPHSDRNHEGDEIPAWTVSLVDDNGEDVGNMTWFHSFRAAESFARSLAAQRKLEYVCEAMQA